MPHIEHVHGEPPLFPPDVVEITMSIGIIASQDHLQWQVEVRNATDGVLIELRSCPHVALSRGDLSIEGAIHLLEDIITEYAGPF